MELGTCGIANTISLIHIAVKSHHASVVKHDGRGLHDRPRCIYEENVKMDLTYVECKYVDWTKMSITSLHLHTWIS
jgi:hypothetical protein